MKFDAEKVVPACQRMETDAQRCLYEHFAPLMMGVCVRYCRSRDEARDLLHDGFVKVFENIRQLKDPNAVQPWMYKIMVNEGVNYLQRHSRVVCCDMSDVMIDECKDVFDTDAFLIEEVLDAMHQLPEIYQIVFNLHEVEEYSFAEIAQSLNVQEGSVRTYLFRARSKIRKILENKKI